MGSPFPEDLSTEELFRRFAPFVARFLYRLGVGPDGLDDLVQEVFLVVHRRGGYKAGQAKPTSYLATIAVNAASAYRRRNRIEQAHSSETEVEGLVSTNQGPVEIVEVSERLRLMQAALERLEPEFRSTLVLCDLEGESCASIAASQGIATGTVYWRLHEARKRFQRALRAELAGIPARSTTAASMKDEASTPERSALLALAAAPLWFFSDARRVLRKGRAEVPVRYDVASGLARHRELAGATPAPAGAASLAPAAAPGAVGLGVGIAAITAVAAAFFVYSLPHRGEEERAHVASVIGSAAAPQTVEAVKVAEPVASEKPTHLTAPAASPSSRTPELEPVHATGTPSDGSPPQSGALATPSASAPVVRTPASGTSGSAALENKKAPPPATAPSAPELPAPELPAPELPANDMQLEAREIARAERILSSNPAGALSIVRSARSQFAPSFLSQERDYVEVMALQALGRSGDAQAAAARFLGAYPGSAFSSRVRRVLEK